MPQKNRIFAISKSQSIRQATTEFPEEPTGMAAPKDNLSTSSSREPNGTTPPEWKNGTKSPRPHEFWLDDCGTIRRSEGIGRNHLFYPVVAYDSFVRFESVEVCRPPQLSDMKSVWYL
jgi:hypothetical protein